MAFAAVHLFVRITNIDDGMGISFLGQNRLCILLLHLFLYEQVT